MKPQKLPHGTHPGPEMQFFPLKPQDDVAETQACRSGRVAENQPDER